ncbi:MAG: hypothetical protein F6K19_47140 [Cyanothece sp. SIO1E1]|nr:hypothetical protein [Cyanothece sp. SIO1E1]
MFVTAATADAVVAGIACESLPQRLGPMGDRTRTIQYASGYDVEIWRVNPDDYYARVRGEGFDFTTPSFLSADEIMRYLSCYFNDGSQC